MKTIVMVVVAVVVAVGGYGFLKVRAAMAGEMQTPSAESDGVLWDLSATTLEGEDVSLGDWAGRVVLVVNVASKCGLTPQYEGLEALYKSKSDDGLVILGFPSNDFLKQEPGTAEEIRAFCTSEYGVTFPLFAKGPVTGDDMGKVHRFLTAGGLEEPTWNFTKYLVGRDGRVIARFSPKTAPDDAEMLAAIDDALKAE